jgi:hypothetical protein
MKTVREYIVETEALADVVTIAMPVGAVALSACNRFGRLSIWAMSEVIFPEAKEPRRFRLTGPIGDDDTSHFLGTVLLNSGNMVLHVFDLGRA